MKTITVLLASFALLPAIAAAGPFSEFQGRVRSDLIKPFARDLGGLIGAATFEPTPPLGFLGVPGFDVRAAGVLQFKADKDDRILRDAGIDAFGLPMAQAMVGLPLGVDLVAHGMRYESASIIGGGARYCVFKSGLLTSFLPSVEVEGFGDSATHSTFKATHFALNGSAVWDLLIVSPFVGIGYDSTKVTVKSASLPALNGLSETANAGRVHLGLDVTPLPFTRLRAAYVIMHGQPGVQLNGGVRF